MTQTELNRADLVMIRPITEADRAFIFASWLKGLRYGNSWYELIDKDLYFKVYNSIINQLLHRSETKIACLKEDPSVILGYAVIEKNRLHWLHVKKAWRKIGIARSLVPSNITTVTHLSEVGRVIFLKKNWIFDPFMVS